MPIHSLTCHGFPSYVSSPSPLILFLFHPLFLTAVLGYVPCVFEVMSSEGIDLLSCLYLLSLLLWITNPFPTPAHVRTHLYNGL